MLEQIGKAVSEVFSPSISAKELSNQVLKPEKVIETQQKEVQEEAKTDKPELDKVLAGLNSMPIIGDNLRFSYANDENQLLVQIRDKKTDDLIRQYPSEEFLTRLRYYRDNIGVLFDAIG